MEEKYLQAGFEIKLACDALSRRILRWHWEKTPRPNGLRDLMAYVSLRAVEEPDYYANMAKQTGCTTWQQLDTTFCTRVLLDAEVKASVKKELLHYALKESTARRACNGLRIARNSAAHATSKEDVVKAIATFDETLEDLEIAYGMMLFEENELLQYDELVKSATAACMGKGKVRSSVKSSSAVGTIGKTSTGSKSASGRAAAGTSGNKTATSKKTATGKNTQSSKSTNHTKQPPKKEYGREKGFLIVALLIFVAAMWFQANIII